MGEEQRTSEDSNGQEESEADGETSLDASDELYGALSNVKRRRFLAYLLEEPRRRTLDEAARVLAGWAAVDDGSMSTTDDYEDVRIELHHRHLPLLDDAGLVAYDPDEHVIEPVFDSSTGDRIRDVLDDDDDRAA